MQYALVHTDLFEFSRLLSRETCWVDRGQEYVQNVLSVALRDTAKFPRVKRLITENAMLLCYVALTQPFALEAHGVIFRHKVGILVFTNLQDNNCDWFSSASTA